MKCRCVLGRVAQADLAWQVPQLGLTVHGGGSQGGCRLTWPQSPSRGGGRAGDGWGPSGPQLTAGRGRDSNCKADGHWTPCLLAALPGVWEGGHGPSGAGLGGREERSQEPDRVREGHGRLPNPKEDRPPTPAETGMNPEDPELSECGVPRRTVAAPGQPPREEAPEAPATPSDQPPDVAACAPPRPAESHVFRWAAARSDPPGPVWAVGPEPGTVFTASVKDHNTQTGQEGHAAQTRCESQRPEAAPGPARGGPGPAGPSAPGAVPESGVEAGFPVTLVRLAKDGKNS